MSRFAVDLVPRKDERSRVCARPYRVTINFNESTSRRRDFPIPRKISARERRVKNFKNGGTCSDASSARDTDAPRIAIRPTNLCIDSRERELISSATPLCSRIGLLE